ncbi:MAG TPA: outer membrane beta-barrel protein, partial [Tenuifilaceae bacterium]|nr:outer membrane beta-barrel protein [Tenuifilaceae bacterium]
MNRLKVEYRRTTFYPSAWTLSPYRIEIDSMTALIGNPMLSPSVRDAVELSHSFRKLPFSINSTVYFHSTNKLVSSNKSYDSNAFCTITYNNS